MEYNIIYDPADAIIMIVIQGETQLGALSKMMQNLAITLIETQRVRVLIDVWHLENKLSLIEMLTLSGMIQSIANEYNIDMKTLRRAMVSRNTGKMLEIYEIITKHVGGPFRRFQDVESAKAWLME